MNNIDTSLTTRRIGAPDGVTEDDCATINVVDAQYVVGDQPPWPFMVTFWKPTPEEVAQLASGGAVRLGIQGTQHPVIFLGTVSAFELKNGNVV